MSLPLLPAAETTAAVSELEDQINADSAHDTGLRQLLAYVKRQWITRRSVGPERLSSVRDNTALTNSVLESFHAALRRRIKVSHQNLYSFLAQCAPSADQTNDMHAHPERTADKTG